MNSSKSINKIDWDKKIWKNDTNLKAYIHKFGNPPCNLNEMSYDELLNFAICTEKANAIIEEDNILCEECNKLIDQCLCDRCDRCYTCQKKCQCLIETLKKNINSTEFLGKFDDIDINIKILSLKIKLKIFIYEKALKCKNIEKDIFNLFIYIVEKYGSELNQQDKKNITFLFKKIELLPKITQLNILKNMIENIYL